MSVLQRHVPPFDTVEAARGQAADELAAMSIGDLYGIALVAATALKGVPGIEGSKREIYDRCCDALSDFFTAPEIADLGRDDYANARESVWSGPHPTAPVTTFNQFARRQ